MIVFLCTTIYHAIDYKYMIFNLYHEWPQLSRMHTPFLPHVTVKDLLWIRFSGVTIMKNSAVHARTTYIVVAHMPASTNIISIMQKVGFTLVFIHAWFAFCHDRLVSVTSNFRCISHNFFFIIRFDDATATTKIINKSHIVAIVKVRNTHRKVIINSHNDIFINLNRLFNNVLVYYTKNYWYLKCSHRKYYKS